MKSEFTFVSNCVGCWVDIRVHYMNCSAGVASSNICFHAGYCLTLWIS